MWWIVGLVILYGIAQTILESLQKEVAIERKQWEDTYQQVEREVKYQQQLIEKKLSVGIDLLKYQEIVNLHSASIKVADTTHELLQGARKTLDAMGRAIVETAKQRKSLEQRKRNSIFGKRELEREIVSLQRLRDEILIPDKDRVKEQRNRLLSEVRRLNRQTAELREIKKELQLRLPQEKRNPNLPEPKESWVFGKVKWFDKEKGYGFIQTNNNGPDVYVNAKQLINEQWLNNGDNVKFILKQGDKPWASRVTKV